MTNKLPKVLLGAGMLILLVLIVWSSTQRSASAEVQTVDLRSSSTPLEVVTESLSREVLSVTTAAMGSLPLEGLGSIDPHINPTANVMIYCDGTGYAELDNRRSTMGIGFEILVGDDILYRFVEAGEMLQVSFVAPQGTVVTAQTGEGVPYAMVPVPMCSAAR